MLENLQFELERLPHAYPNEPGAELELWGRLTVRVIGAAGPRLLTETEWDLSEFAAWFSEHQRSLCSEQIVGTDGKRLSRPGETLAETLLRAQGLNFPDDESNYSWLNYLFQFRTRHVLTFALRGARVEPLVIGCNGGAGEISSLNDSSVRHRFYMHKFLEDVQKQTRALVHDWQGQRGTNARMRAQALLRELNATYRNCCNELTSPLANGHRNPNESEDD